MFGRKKRKFSEIQLSILKRLRRGKKTIYQLSKETRTHFRTIRHQLVLLRGHGYVDLAFELDHIKIFAINNKGEEYLKRCS